MIGWTMGLYSAGRFMRYILLIFLLFFFLIIAVDLIELSRSVAKQEHVGFVDVIELAALRAPSIAGNVFPFAVLFGGTLCLLLLNKRLELVVARASGVSVWQFLAPVLICAVALGLFSSMIYNPVSLSLLNASKTVEAHLFGKVKGSFSNKSQNFWLRVGQESGDAIIRARVSQNQGQQLTAVSVYRFDKDGNVIERIDADAASFVGNASGGNSYEMKNAVVTIPGRPGTSQDGYTLPVNISKDQLQINTAIPQNIPYWNLRQQAERAKAAGRNYRAFLTHHASMSARPILFIAMVILAACISLRFARFGQSGRMILGGILAGFVLYVLSEIVLSFGSNGLVPPTLAAWAPAIVASLLGSTVLLYQEDG